MNQDLIHDALNLLDDDMIQETDALRLREQPGRDWTAWMRRAACLFLFFAALCLFIPVFTIHQKNAPRKPFQDKTDTFSSEPLQGSDDLESSHDPADTEESSSGEALQDIALTVTALTEDGFSGIVTEIWDGYALDPGETVHIFFGDTLAPEDISAFQEGSSVRIHCYIDASSGSLTACRLISVKP